MAKANLQRKLNCKVLLPMVIGMISILVAAYLPFYISFPTWIDSITDDMIDDRKETLKTLSNYLALAAGSAMNYPSDFLLLASKLIEKYYNATLITKQSFRGTDNYVNSYLLYNGLAGDVYGYNKTTNSSFQTSMWYLQDTYFINQISDSESSSNLRDSAVFDSFIRPIVRVGRPSKGYLFFQNFYIGYEHDGLFYHNPSQYKSYFNSYPASRNCSYMINRPVPLYDPRCRPWFNMIKSSSEKYRVLITEPYKFADGGYIGQTFCVGSWKDNTNFRFAACIDYDMSQLRSKIDVIDKGSTTYAFAVSPEGQTFVHPKFTGLCENTDDCLSSITEIEMQGASQSEKKEFIKKVVDKFSSPEIIIEKYKKKGEKIIIAIAPIFGKVYDYQRIAKVGNIGLRLQESKMTDPFDDLKSNLNKLLYIEGFALMIIISIVLVFCWLLTRYVTLQIIKPIDNLIKILERLKDGDVDINIEDQYQLCSKELTKLYTVFTKLKIVLKFGKKSYFTEDSEALMNYAQALTLFLEFRNMERAGTCYNNMGVIHLRNHRYQEAIACFAKAYELAQNMKINPELINKRKKMLATTMLSLKKFAGKPPQLMLDLIETYKSLHEYTKAVECLLVLSEHTSSKPDLSETYLKQAESLVDKSLASQVPREILYSKITYCQGLILKTRGLLRESCQTFIHCISAYKIFDPETRSKALSHLNEIYSNFATENKYFDLAEEGCKNLAKDVVFVIDYSISMNGSRIQRALAAVCNLVDNNLKPDDRVAFITFNKTCNIAFNLTPRGAESRVLREKIMKWDSPKGATSFYDAINLSLQEFLAYGPQQEFTVPFDEQEMEKEVRLKWIVALVDGEDNTSSYTARQIKKKIVKTSVNLVVVGLNLPKEFKDVMKDLCQVTIRGIYIDSPNLSDLEKAFQTISILISSRSENIENLD